MAMANLAAKVAEAFEHRLRLSENPFCSSVFNELLGLPPVSYQQHLDRVRVNVYGETIPRIALVRDNLQRLGTIRLDPARLR